MIVRLGDVVRQVRSNVDDDLGGLERYVAGEHMDTDELRLSRWGTVGDGYLGPAFRRRFRPGQVLYGSRRTYLRKVAVAPFEGICANTTFVCESADRDQLLPELVPFVLSTEAFHQYSISQSKGSVNPYVNWSDIAAFKLALPPLVRQRDIAELLLAAQAANEHWSDAVAAHERTFRAALNGAVAEDVAQGIYPARELGDVQAGRQRSPKHERGEAPHPYLRVANVFDGYFDLTDVKRMDFSRKEREVYELRAGDVLLNEGQSRELVGRSAVCDDSVAGLCFQNTLIRFRHGPDILSQYAQACFRHAQYSGQFAAIASQTTSIAHLGVERFAQFRMPCPSLARQREVVALLQDISEAGQTMTRQQDRVKDLHRAAINEFLPQS